MTIYSEWSQHWIDKIGWSEPGKWQNQEIVNEMINKGIKFRKCQEGDKYYYPYSKGGYIELINGEWVADEILAKERKQNLEMTIKRYQEDPDHFIMGG